MMTSQTEMQTYANLAGRSGSAGVIRTMPSHNFNPASKAHQSAAQATPTISNSFMNRLLSITFGLTAVSVLLFVAACYFGDDISRGGHSASQKKLEIVVGHEVLHIPENLIRYSNQRKSGIHQRLELYIHWPKLAGYSDDLSAEFNASSSESELIFATLEKRGMAYDMSGRISSIYERFFVGEPKPYSSGLVKQALSAKGGFIDEDLYYAAGSPYPFATRCVRESSAVGTPYCLRDIHVTENLSLTYRFHKRMLGEWIAIDRQMRALVKGMILRSVGS